MTRVSNTEIGRHLLKRLHELREESERSGDTVLHGRKVRRSWVAGALGCRAEILSQNPKIRRFLKDWDDSIGHPQRPSPEIVAEATDVADTGAELNVVKLRTRQSGNKSMNGKIRWDTVYDVVGNAHRVPVLYQGNGIDENASNWFRYLVIGKGLESQSVEQTVSIVRSFKEFLRRLKIPELEVTDDTFITWKNFISARVKPSRVNICLQTVHAFYQYLEKTGVLTYWVQIYDADALPTEFKAPYVFPITSKPVVARSKQGVVTKGWTTPFHLREGPSASRATPTESAVKKLHSRTRRQKHGVRNSILLSLAERTGARVGEILQVRLSQLPDPARMMEIIERGLRFEVFVKRKRRHKPMPLMFDKYILIRIIKYIEQERAEIVKRFPDTAGKSDFLFLGDRGTPLKADSVTHLVLELFNGVLNDAGIHRLRSKFAIDKLETLITSALEMGIEVGPTSNHVESVLQVLAQEMGQASIASLRPYLPLVFGRKLMTTKSAVIEENERKLIETERLLFDQEMRIDMQIKKLDRIATLVEAGDLIARGQKLAAAKKLEETAAALRGAA